MTLALDRYAVLGHPVAHSRSPWIHARFAAQTGQALRYDRMLCPLDGFAASVHAFAAAPALGCNVTVPFKFEAFALAPRRTPRAALAEAANVLRFDAEGWLADNSDGIGLVRDIEHNAGVPLAGKRLLLLGAGGAAAGVLGPILEAGAAEVVVANRSPERAQQLVQRHWPLAHERGAALAAQPLEAAGTGFDVVVNATAASLAGAELPLRDGQLRPGALAVDLMYGPATRPFLDAATRLGATGRDGLGMLVEQAAEAFFLWRGVRPRTAEVLAELRAQVDAPK